MLVVKQETVLHDDDMAHFELKDRVLEIKVFDNREREHVVLMSVNQDNPMCDFHFIEWLNAMFGQFIQRNYNKEVLRYQSTSFVKKVGGYKSTAEWKPVFVQEDENEDED